MAENQTLYEYSATAGEFTEGKTARYTEKGTALGTAAGVVLLPGVGAQIGAAVGSAIGGAIGLFGTTKGRRALREDAHRILNFGRDIRDFFVDAWETAGRYVRRAGEWLGLVKRRKRRKRLSWNFENAAKFSAISMLYRGNSYIELPSGPPDAPSTQWRRIETGIVWNPNSLTPLVGGPQWNNTDRLYSAMNDQFQKARDWSRALGDDADAEVLFAYALHSLFKFATQDKINDISQWQLVLPEEVSREQALRLLLSPEGQRLREQRQRVEQLIELTSGESTREGSSEALERVFGNG
jgi:hypothetical protein